MDDPLVRQVRARAAGACEYCRIPEAYYPVPSQIDHVIARVPCPRLCRGHVSLEQPMPTQSRGHGTRRMLRSVLLVKLSSLVKELLVSTKLFSQPLGEGFAVLGRGVLGLIKEIRLDFHPVSLADAEDVVPGNDGIAQQFVDTCDQFFLSVWIEQVRADRLE